ncbi:MAG: hypothetical protein R6V57_00690 [Vicinamibacterales bacterium]
MFKRVATGVAFVSHQGLLWACIGTLVALSTACSGIDQQPANPASPTMSTAMTGASQSSSAAAALQSAKGPATVPRDVRGTLDGRFDFTRMWGGEWWQFYSDSHVTGTMSHLGLTHVYTTHVPNLGTGALTQGTFRIVAANGDEIRGTYEGAGTYDAHRTDLVHGAATFVISGGTGRFDGATGTINATFLETLDDPTWASAKVAWTLAGTVNY